MAFSLFMPFYTPLFQLSHPGGVYGVAFDEFRAEVPPFSNKPPRSGTPGWNLRGFRRPFRALDHGPLVLAPREGGGRQLWRPSCMVCVSVVSGDGVDFGAVHQ